MSPEGAGAGGHGQGKGWGPRLVRAPAQPSLQLQCHIASPFHPSAHPPTASQQQIWPEVQELQNQHPPPLPVLRGDAALLWQNRECSHQPWAWGTSLQGKPKHCSRGGWLGPCGHDPVAMTHLSSCPWGGWGGGTHPGIATLLWVVTLWVPSIHLLPPQLSQESPEVWVMVDSLTSSFFPAPRVSPGIQLASLQ